MRVLPGDTLLDTDAEHFIDSSLSTRLLVRPPGQLHRSFFDNRAGAFMICAAEPSVTSTYKCYMHLNVTGTSRLALCTLRTLAVHRAGRRSSGVR